MPLQKFERVQVAFRSMLSLLLSLSWGRERERKGKRRRFEGRKEERGEGQRVKERNWRGRENEGELGWRKVENRIVGKGAYGRWPSCTLGISARCNCEPSSAKKALCADGA